MTETEQFPEPDMTKVAAICQQMYDAMDPEWRAECHLLAELDPAYCAGMTLHPLMAGWEVRWGPQRIGWFPAEAVDRFR